MSNAVRHVPVVRGRGLVLLAWQFDLRFKAWAIEHREVEVTGVCAT
ncbi:MAG TPA: hypothetical protein PLZ57_08555 [Pseudobdellovibrionaceae bacterium]|nr:hypothetical protein [Pseudobdellovibrionaceae bacterium]